jgi:hypothetical protein
MPHLVVCAASAVLSPNTDSQRDHSLKADYLKSLASRENPLLERFLLEQMPAPVLRSDLDPLPRFGRPKIYDSAFKSSSNPKRISADASEQDCGRQTSKSLRTTAPEISFANYIWATSASRKMKFEAIYI